MKYLVFYSYKKAKLSINLQSIFDYTIYSSLLNCFTISYLSLTRMCSPSGFEIISNVKIPHTPCSCISTAYVTSRIWSFEPISIVMNKSTYIFQLVQIFYYSTSLLVMLDKTFHSPEFLLNPPNGSH